MKAIAIVLCAVTSVSALDPDIVLDDADNPASIIYSPAASWVTDNDTTNAFRGSAKKTNGGSSASAKFHTMLPKRGAYQVFAWHNGRAGFSTSMWVAVTHADATAGGYLSQTTNSGQWLSLGSFWFEGADSASYGATPKEAKVEFLSYSATSADAVRFMPVTADVVLDSTNTSIAGAISLLPGFADWQSVTDKAGNCQTVRRSGNPNASVQFNPTLPADGDYDISLWLPPSNGSWVTSLPVTNPVASAASAFQVDVYHRTGMKTLNVSLPATRGASEGRWVHLANPDAADGSFRFNKTTAGQQNPPKVIVRVPQPVGGNDNWVPVDAIRFGKVGAGFTLMDEDDGDPAVTASPSPGTWSTSSPYIQARNWQYYKNNAFGPVHKYATASYSGSVTQRMIYTPAISALGLYDIYVWYPYDSYNSQQVQATVHAADGDFSITLNQTAGGGSWAFLGRHILYPSSDPDAAKRPWVRLAIPSSTGGQYHAITRADGMLFLRDGEDADGDVDGLPDWHEQLLQTSINPNDGDGDGHADGWDTDSDELFDFEEYLLGTSPRVAGDPLGSAIVGLNVFAP